MSPHGITGPLRPKFTKFGLARPLRLPNFITLGQTMYEKCITNFLHPSVFWRPGVPPDQSSPDLGNKCRSARPLTLPNFNSLQQKVCKISAVKNLCSRKSGSKFTNIPYDCYAPMPVTVPDFMALGQTVYEKSITKFFYTLPYSGAPGSPGPKFTNLGSDI